MHMTCCDSVNSVKLQLDAPGNLQVSVVSVGLDKGIFLWDIRKDAPVRVVPDAHLHEITCVAVNHAGTLIATGGADCAVKLWDFGSGRPVGMYAGAYAGISA